MSVWFPSPPPNDDEKEIAAQVDEAFVDTDPTILPRVKGSKPIKGYKAASILILKSQDIREFLNGKNINLVLPGYKITPEILAEFNAEFNSDKEYATFAGATSRCYSADEDAVCGSISTCWHGDGDGMKVPVVACSCGFYAWKSPTRLDEFSIAAKLEVELSGKVIETSRGYRAEHQKVMRVDFGHMCALCAHEKATGLRVYNDGAQCQVLPTCDRCVKPELIVRTITNAELSGLIGTEVVWQPMDKPSRANIYLKSIVPVWTVLILAMLATSYGLVSSTIGAFILMCALIVHIPYNMWLHRQFAVEYFKPRVIRKK